MVLGKLAKPEPKTEEDDFQDLIFPRKKKRKLLPTTSSDSNSESSSKPIKTEAKKYKSTQKNKSIKPFSLPKAKIPARMKKEKLAPKTLEPVSHNVDSIHESLESGDDSMLPDDALHLQPEFDLLTDFKFEDDDRKEYLDENNDFVSTK